MNHATMPLAEIERLLKSPASPTSAAIAEAMERSRPLVRDALRIGHSLTAQSFHEELVLR